MPALPSVDETDRLSRILTRACWAFWLLVGAFLLLACIVFTLKLAGDDVLPAPLNSIVFLAVVGAAVIVHAEYRSTGTRLKAELDQARCRADLAEVHWQVERLVDRLDGPTQPLRVVASVAVPATPPPDNVIAFELGRQAERNSRQ